MEEESSAEVMDEENDCALRYEMLDDLLWKDPANVLFEYTMRTSQLVRLRTRTAERRKQRLKQKAAVEAVENVVSDGI